LSKYSNIAVSKDSVKKKAKVAKGRIRVSPNNYLVSICLCAFFSALLFYIGYDKISFAFFFVSVIVIPILYFNDKIELKSDSIEYTGLLRFFWSKISENKIKLKISEIEQIETQAIRALKRGGTVFYRYRTSVRGNNTQFSFASGGENYRNFLHKLFPKVDDDVLDNRSIELRDYLIDSKEVLMKAAFAKIPSSEVLESSLEDFTNKKVFRSNTGQSSEDIEKSENLRQLANELRITGNLLQSLEVFRRALLISPKNALLLFEFSRCLNSYSGVEKNPKMYRRSKAALRLAQSRTIDNPKLLARIGESYFQNGELNRARFCFQKSIDNSEVSFRALRGLAEISLREGKIAHVIHHFSKAKDSTDCSALEFWAEKEVEYFSKLNNNETYMEAEVQRIHLLETFRKHKAIALRITGLGLFIILLGNYFDILTITNIGWAMSTISVIAWSCMFVGNNVLMERIPSEVFDEVDDDDID
jgi:tetratricopeptide (TPR) repeat protein